MISLPDFDWDDELIHETKLDGQPRAHVYRASQVAVVLGRGSQPDLEINVEAAKQDGIPVLRRRGGGCAVVLDTGNVIVSCALPLPGLGGTKAAFRMISDWLIDALGQTGVAHVRQAGISDLALGEHKIGGACIYRTKGLMYYTTTLLYQPDLDLVERYLKHPPREPDYRAGRTHTAFMGSLTDLLPHQNIGSFAQQMNEALSGTVETVFEKNLSIGGHNNQTTSRHEVMA